MICGSMEFLNVRDGEGILVQTNSTRNSSDISLVIYYFFDVNRPDYQFPPGQINAHITFRDDPHSYIGHVFLDPNCERRGIAQKFMAKAIEVILAARHIYEKFGFKFRRLVVRMVLGLNY